MTLGQISFSVLSPGSHVNPKLDDGYEPYSTNEEVKGLWSGWVRHGYDAPKCNIFVYDALEGGAPGGSAPLARQWGSPNAEIPDYRVINPAKEKLEPGDVIAKESEPGEWHVGIYSPAMNQQGQIVDRIASANTGAPGVPVDGGRSEIIGHPGITEAKNTRC
jgi:hypothetical protein